MAADPQTPQGFDPVREVFQIQLNQLNSSLTAGIASIERTMDRNAEDVKKELRNVGERLSSVETTLVRHEGRIEGLESHRRTQLLREEEARRASEDERVAAQREIEGYRLWARLGKGLAATLSVLGVIFGILTAVGVFH